MEWVLEIIEMNKIVLGCIVITGQVCCKVMMDIHRNINIMMMIILLEVVKVVLSKQQRLSFMELIH